MRTVLRMIGRLLVGLTLIYCVGVFILALLWLIGMQGIWWLDLANIFALYLFIPLLLIVPIAWLVPTRRLRGVAVLAVAAFFGLFGPRLIPPAVQRTGGAPLRVATFNLHYSIDQAQLADIFTTIRSEHLDVVALQELSVPAAAAIQQNLLGDYPYQALVPSATSYTGMGVISHYALEVLRPTQQIPGQLVLVRMGNTDVSLINVSLTKPEIKQRYLPVVGWVRGLGGYRINKRSREIERLLPAIDQLRGPLIVAGDFNLSDREPDYAQFAARFHDAYRETNWGFGHTFPNSMRLGVATIPFPLIRVDYIWSAGGVVPAATRVVCGTGSDHCMVIAEVQVGAGAVPASATLSR
jgi:vancomycin resistance protein VanJ